MDELIYYGVLLLLKALFWLVDLVGDLIFGYKITAGSRREREGAKDYGRSAHLVRVLWRAHSTDLNPHSLINFLYVHEEYVSPDYITENANVTLFTMDKDCATFCVVDPGIDIYDTKVYPFVFDVQYFEPKRLLVLPLSSFNRLADEVGDPTVPVSVIHMTTRCGSTLISQLANRVPRTRSMSEPCALERLSERYQRGHFSWEEYRMLVRSCVRLQCKVESGSGVERIVLKASPVSSSAQFELIHEFFPDFVLIFNTRHPRTSILSILKLVEAVDNCLYSWSGLLWNYLVYEFAYPYTEKHQKIFRGLSKWRRPMSYEEALAYGFYALPFAAYLEAKHIYKHVVLYENLVAHSEIEATRLFRAMGIPTAHVPAALKALERDSQEKRFGERGNKHSLSQEMWAKMDRILEEYGTGLRADMTMEEFKEVIRQ